MYASIDTKRHTTVHLGYPFMIVYKLIKKTVCGQNEDGGRWPLAISKVVKWR